MDSYCCQCDAPEGGCDHQAPRYLDDIVYEKAGDGWAVPEHERERWENPVRVVKPATPDAVDVPPVQRLIVELEGWVILSDNLEQLVRTDYEQEPVVAARLVASTIDGAKNGRLKNPGGYLYKQLKARLERPAPD